MTPTSERIEYLDGLRGIAALWVMLGHATLLVGASIPILNQPDLGVDLFIMLSGFVMVFQFNLRSTKEPWESKATWVSFWLRRFFRIAPLYYLCLAAALILGPMLFEARSDIASYLPGQAQLSSRYNDSSLLNIAMHVSFLFGAVPNYAFRTPLPD